MLKVLLVCAEMAEGCQTEPGDLLMTILGLGEALAAGDDPLPFDFVVFLLHSLVGSIPSLAFPKWSSPDLLIPASLQILGMLGCTLAV